MAASRFDLNKPIFAKKKAEVDELKIALENRAFEIQLFWQRSNYFLVLMTALGVGTFSVKDPIFSPLVAFLATLGSLLWVRTNLGSKFWQESWEVEVTILAKESRIRSFEKSTTEVIDQVRGSFLKEQGHHKSFFRKLVNALVLRKPSVTYSMILLSMVSTAVWALVTVVFLVRLDHALCHPYRPFFVSCSHDSKVKSPNPPTSPVPDLRPLTTPASHPPT